MTTHAWILLVAFLAILFLLAWPMGAWLAAVGEGRLPRWLRPIARLEEGLYRLAGVNSSAGMGWKQYALALLVFNTLGVIAVYALQRWQVWLPLNPQGMAAVTPDSAFNTAVSFVSNTNWQGYGGEATMSYLTQMMALVGAELLLGRDRHRRGVRADPGLRGAVGRGDRQLLGRCHPHHAVRPVAAVDRLRRVPGEPGCIQNFDAYTEVATLEPVTYQQPKAGPDGQPVQDAQGKPVMEDVTRKTQTLAMGPVASQEAIKMLGTNGGGFFNANSAHPYENPTPLANFVQMLSIFLIPAGLVFAFGRMVGDPRQGLAVLAAMTVLFVVAVLIAIPQEQAGNPQLAALGVDQAVSDDPARRQHGGQGGALRHRRHHAVRGDHDRRVVRCGERDARFLHPARRRRAAGAHAAGEVVFGGVGTGLYGMLIFAILAVFIAGLMIGRTPEYLGKKIESFEMKMTSVAILVTPILVLAGTAVAVLADAGRVGIANPGPHGFSEILYAFSSAANNNGSAFAGLSANTPFYNTLLAVAMWFGRFGVIVPVLAIAGSLAAKKRLSPGAGTLPTHGPLFVVLLIGAVLLVGLLNYVPALALGPVVEHLMLWSGK